jgi:predicted RND superfamily exporter protein
MQRLSQWLVCYRFPLLVAIGIITVLLSIRLPHLHTTDEENTWFTAQDTILTIYKNFQEEFPSRRGVLVAFQVEDPFTPANIAYLNDLGQRLLTIRYASEVQHLANIEIVRGTDEGLTVEKLLADTSLLAVRRTQLQERIRGNPFIYGNLISHDWHTLAIWLKFKLPDEESRPKGNIYVEIVRALRQFLDEETRLTGRQFHFSGELVMDGEINAIIAHDILIFFPLSLLISFLIIYFLFNTPGSVALSLATVVIALIWTLGLMAWLDVPLTPVSATLFALINIIGLANAIHLLSQLGIELGRGFGRQEAISRTLRLAGKPCFFTSLTTAVGFGSLAVSRIPAIRDLGYFAAFGIMTAYLLALVLIPACSSSPKFRFQLTSHHHADLFKPLLERIVQINYRFPQLILILYVVLIGLLALGIPLIKTEASLLEYLKKSARLYQDTHFIDRHLTGVSSIELGFRGTSDEFLAPDNLQAIATLQDSLRQLPTVGAVLGGTDLLMMINRALNADRLEEYCLPRDQAAIAQSFLLYEIAGGSLLSEYLNGDYSAARLSVITKQCSNEARQQMLALIQDFCRQQLPHLELTVTGVDYLVNIVTQRIIQTQLESLLLAFIVIAGLMLLQFGWKAGLVSLIPNIFPVVLTIGLMGLGGFKLNMATAIIASIAIGIVVDDTIHFFAHFKTAYQQHANRSQAVREALMEVGPAIISASLVLTLGFLIEMLSQTNILLEFGILASVAILSALVGDLFVGPVLLARWQVFRLPPAPSPVGLKQGGPQEQ